MHNNYYFLRQLSVELSHRIVGYTLVSCFSQNKDELIIEFNAGAKSFFIKASFTAEFQCLSFPGSFHRARKNSIDLFPALAMSKVIGVRQFINERSFAIQFEHDNALVFKMHSARSNVLWFTGEVVQEIFRNNFRADFELKLHELDRSIDWSYEHFAENQLNLKSIYFTFGNPIWRYLEEHHYDELNLEAKWSLLKATLAILEKPTCYIDTKEGIVSFSLLPSSGPSETISNPVDAINEFFSRKVSTGDIYKERAFLRAQVNGKLKQAESYNEKNRDKLSELEVDVRYQQWADLIMANLHKIKKGVDKIEVENLYDDHKLIEINLKKEVSPQKNAEIFYRKAKNQAIEIGKLKESLDRKGKEIKQLTEWINAINAAHDMNALKKISASVLKQSPDKQAKQSVPYHEHEFKGFKIWVGKNAAANDTLTQKYSHKEDLWLHAKDVAGSHVLIKYQSGKPFPKDVIERAAGLAAYHSKRKNEALCPVAFTTKKYVRKRKGDPAGMVVVEKEDVILVEPRK